MPDFAISGSDTLTLWDRVFTDFADGDNFAITYPEDLVMASTGKNENTIFAKNEKGNNGLITMRLLRGSPDDRYMQKKQAESDRDFAATVLANGEFVKRMGDGTGSVINDTYRLQGGMINKRVEAKENVSGDTDQAIAIYTMTFASAKRVTR